MKIIHIDMDAFFASVEQRDHPAWRNKPVVVGRSHPRGVIAAASYEARKFGIRSAMPSKKALQLCPQVIFATPRFEVYKAVSKEIHDIFAEHTDLIEPLSLDEAYLDVTENKNGIELAQEIARDIKQKIQTELHLTASAGVSYNKFLAKIASDMQKPDGLTVIHPQRAMKVIAKLPIEAFWGVGKVTAQRMHEWGIHTGKDLAMVKEEFLVSHFGKLGKLLAEFAQGYDHRKVEPHRKRLSVGCERTFEQDIFGMEKIIDQFPALAEELEKRIHHSQFEGETFTLKIKRSDFKQMTRSRTTTHCPVKATDFIEQARNLVTSIPLDNQGVRLIGFSVGKASVNRDDVILSTIDTQLLIPFDPY